MEIIGETYEGEKIFRLHGEFAISESCEPMYQDDLGGICGFSSCLLQCGYTGLLSEESNIELIKTMFFRSDRARVGDFIINFSENEFERSTLTYRGSEIKFNILLKEDIEYLEFGLVDEEECFIFNDGLSVIAFNFENDRDDFILITIEDENYFVFDDGNTLINTSEPKFQNYIEPIMTAYDGRVDEFLEWSEVVNLLSEMKKEI